jgi:hypothetical protein
MKHLLTETEHFKHFIFQERKILNGVDREDRGTGSGMTWLSTGQEGLLRLLKSWKGS